MMDMIFDLPWTITGAWAVVLAWGIAQWLWFRKLRVMPAPPPPRRRDSAIKRPAANKAAMTTLPTGGTPEFLAELGLHEPESSSAAPAESVYR